MENQGAYRSIFKATSLFGGVQLYKILIGIIKSKFIAVLLGPTGLGIQGLLTAGTDLIKQLTSMGLAQSAVRDVAEAKGSGDIERVNRTVSVLQKLVWGTGLLGLVLVAVLSPVLSKSSFGNYDYTIPFIILSVTLLLDQLSAGQLVVLQGMRRLKELAKASAIGSTVGLVVSVPLYYWLGVRGIVPTLILNSVTALLLSWLYSRRVEIKHIRLSFKQAIREGKVMLNMGIAMSISTILTSLCAFVLKGFISNQGGAAEVGLYTAGAAIITTYVGMIFNAISTDYYPRLAAVNTNNEKCREVINQQGEIAALILGAILTICLVLMPIIIKILYSDAFLASTAYVVWASLGMMFKLASWLISYQFVAKGESKLFIGLEICAGCYMLVFNILGYRLMGIMGLGISFAIGYLVYFTQVFIIARKRYDFSFTGNFLKVFLVEMSVLILTLVSVLVLDGLLRTISCIFLCVIVGLYSIRELDRRLEIIALIKNRVGR